MAKDKYLRAPIPTDKMPNSIPYIVTNECAERFSFYGMKTILTIFMTQYLMGTDGNLSVMSETEATTWFHVFSSAVYFTPILGALLSDIFLAKYKTIISLSIVYCLGHLALAMDETRMGLTLGLTLIAIGSGGIKSCVSANVGDQFGKSNQHLLPKIFGIFYFAINLGSFFSTILTPVLLKSYGPRVAFGVPGGLMLFATIVFWMGRNKYVHVPPSGVRGVKEAFGGDSFRIILRLSVLYVFVAMFWSLFDQTGSSWVLQACKMDRYWLRNEWLSSQIQAVNPLLIMIMIPIFSKLIYPGLNKIFRLTPLRKIAIGLFVAAASFAVISITERNITGGNIFKYSSKTKQESLSPFNLIDGQTGRIGWSSSTAPMPDEPVEIVLRLRERKAWNISSIQIDPATILGHEEMLGILDEFSDTYRKENKKEKRMVMKEAIGKAKDKVPWKLDYFVGSFSYDSLEEKFEAGKAAAAAIRPIGKAVLEELGEDPNLFNDTYYYPREIEVFCADFTDKLLPKCFYELGKDEQKKISDVTAYASEKGWTRVGTMKFTEDGQVQIQQFSPMRATHVYVQIKSNFGADRVKLDEIRVMTDDAIPEESRAMAGDVWPNVAAIGYRPNIFWQVIAYILLTAAEVMVSITGLEFSYTQAPKKLKSFIMSIWLLTVALGNAFASAVNAIISNEDGSSKLAGPNYFWFFTIMMLITAVGFIPVAAKYRVKEYIQDDAPADNQNESPAEG
jgi:POT family proton-dependent oligopeptide transporter